MAIKLATLLLVSLLSIAQTGAHRAHLGAPVSSVTDKGPRNIGQCSCRKSCNPNNDICYSRSICWACYVNGTTDNPGGSLAPSAGDAGFIFLHQLASSKCSCKKACNPGNRLCYNVEACSDCSQEGIAPSANPRRKCNCRNSCDPDHSNACFDENSCYTCVTGNTAVPPNSR